MQRKVQPHREPGSEVVDRLGQLIMSDADFFRLFHEFHHVNRQIGLSAAQLDLEGLQFKAELERLRSNLSGKILEKLSAIISERGSQ